MWKVQNTFLHGTNKKEQRILQIKQCQNKIEELYNRNRTHLTAEQREIFTVPIETRQKQGLDAMALWIETAKLIIESKMKTGQKQSHNVYNNVCLLNVHTTKGRKGKKNKIKQKKK